MAFIDSRTHNLRKNYKSSNPRHRINNKPALVSFSVRYTMFALSLAFAALAFGAPNRRRQLEEGATCTYIGDFTPSGKIAASNLEADELKALMMSWLGKKLEGLPANGGLIWTVDNVTCQ
ncbi:hypothetical protein L218DRAFT_1078091 [Marasmius fiardii PR-910]|nr:hypothetical protein L218DRAFT_1078091 [Marasmius fiardii PR-910]